VFRFDRSQLLEHSSGSDRQRPAGSGSDRQPAETVAAAAARTPPTHALGATMMVVTNSLKLVLH